VNCALKNSRNVFVSGKIGLCLIKRTESMTKALNLSFDGYCSTRLFFCSFAFISSVLMHPLPTYSD